MTEIQPYDVISRHDGYELRRYPPCVLADVEVRGKSFSGAGNAGFGPLLRYISGANSQSRAIAMTAPVTQQDTNQAHMVSFVLPAGTVNPPDPTDRRVSIRHQPEELVAVRRYSGSTGADAFARNLQILQVALQRDGLTPTGPARLARYDPPWQPWFMRRNEAQVPVSQ